MEEDQEDYRHIRVLNPPDGPQTFYIPKTDQEFEIENIRPELLKIDTLIKSENGTVIVIPAGTIITRFEIGKEIPDV